MLLLRKGLLFLLLFAAVHGLFFWTTARVQVGGVPLVYRLSELFHWKGGDAWQRFHGYDPAVRHDVVVLGSSHAYRGYDPELFTARGLDMYNLGSSAQTALQARILMEEWLHAGNTGLLVLEVSKAFLEDEGVESTCELVQNVPAERAAMRMAMSLRDPRAVNLLALRWAMHGRPPQYLSEQYVGRGYCRYTAEADGSKVDGRSGFHPLPGQDKELQRLVASCRARNIPLVLVTHPVPHADPERHRAFAAHLQHLLAGTGVQHIDMAMDHHLDPRRHFADHSHLNQAGVERFVPALLRRLEALGLLPGAPSP